MLIDHGASLNSIDAADCTPLHIAASAANVEAATVLLYEGMKVIFIKFLLKV